MNQILIQRVSRAGHIPPNDELQRWANAALAAGGNHEPVALTLRIVGATEARVLNAQYRHKDYATNVLSFPGEMPDLPESESALRWLGDIVFCATVVGREARVQHKLPAAHWAHLVVHGCLHLLGYDHIQARDANHMEALEIKTLAQLGFPNPYD